MARLVMSSEGRLARLARRVIIHNAARNAMATSVPYVGIKKLPIDINFGSMTYFSLLGPPHVQQQQASANGDGAVGHVEGREIMLAGVDFDKIGHGTVDNSIIQVSERSAQYEGEGGAKHRIALGAGAQKYGSYRDQNGSG